MSTFLKELISRRQILTSRSTSLEKNKTSFREAIHRKEKRPALIAEIKHATPKIDSFEGDHLSVSERAKIYRELGADAISVVIEPLYFKGSIVDIELAKEELPVLAKGFFTSKNDVDAVASYGASAILLLAALSDEIELKDLVAHAQSKNLFVLMEVHTREEVLLSLHLNVDALGINRRDLRTLEIDPSVEDGLWDLIPLNVPVVIESHIESALFGLSERASAALVGSFLMKPLHPAGAIHQLIGKKNDLLKCCGIKNIEEAALARREGASFFGFNLIDSSRRKVKSEDWPPLLHWIAENQIFERSVLIVDQISLVQHRDFCETWKGPIQLHALGLSQHEIKRTILENIPHKKVWLAISHAAILDDELSSMCEVLLVEHPEGGGKGKSHAIPVGDFRRRFSKPILRAGGVCVENVLDLLVGYDGVDVASGIESDGKLDGMKIRKIVDQIKRHSHAI